MVKPLPPSLGWVLLYVDDVASATRLYTTAFGLTTRFEHESGDYTELETGSTTLGTAACFGDSRAVVPDRGPSNLRLVFQTPPVTREDGGQVL